MIKLASVLIRTGVLVLILTSQASCLNCCTSDERATSRLYDSFITAEPVNTAQLNLFFTQMPKGGDLHHHYSGSIYAETYLEWVKENKFWINKKTLQIDEKKTRNSISVDTLYKDTTLYRKLLTLWSDKDFYNHSHQQPPPDSNFFNTFGYFSPVSGTATMEQGLALLKQRAIKENVQYIETMLKTVGYKVSDNNFDSKVRNIVKTMASDPQAMEQALYKEFVNFIGLQINNGKRFKRAVRKYIRMVKKLDEEVNTSPDFHIAFQTYATRLGSPANVFTKLYAGFAAADFSSHIVGVNIVGPENSIVAIRDYTLHMYMFKYMKELFTNVKTSMHAGELVLGMVEPDDLTFHINQAVTIAKTNRVGHGIDIAHEQNPYQLLSTMKEQQVVVEINLTSNEFILGVKDGEHPIHIYESSGVPFVISTDDSGVSRNNLSREYVLLASRYKPDYKEIKSYVYNSLKYSFLSDAKKAELTTELDKKFIEFEKNMAQYAKQMH